MLTETAPDLGVRSVHVGVACLTRAGRPVRPWWLRPGEDALQVLHRAQHDAHAHGVRHDVDAAVARLAQPQQHACRQAQAARQRGICILVREGLQMCHTADTCKLRASRSPSSMRASRHGVPIGRAATACNSVGTAGLDSPALRAALDGDEQICMGPALRQRLHDTQSGSPLGGF